MFKQKLNSVLVITLISTVIIIGAAGVQSVNVNGIESLFTLVAKTNNEGVGPDYLNLIKQQLAIIGINLDIILLPWNNFILDLFTYRDFDLFYVGIFGGDSNIDYSEVYSENASFNFFGYDTNYDWDDELSTGVNEWYLQQGPLIVPPNSNERIQHYYNWQNYLMDEVCPLLPFLVPNNYVGYWSNLEGYNFEDGILQSWGKMFWDGSHNEQITTQELVIADAQWDWFNPIFQYESSARFISSLCLDPLLWFDTDRTIWPHLAESYTFTDNTTLEIKCRQGIKWAPDFEGIFTNEFFDARDLYFTLYIWRYFITSTFLRWIDDMQIIDDYTLRISIDSSKFIEGKQPYASCLEDLNLLILPEHYLNQSQLHDGVTPDITHPSWDIFGNHCFGTGLFELYDYTKDYETILKTNPNSWWLNEELTNNPSLDWARRFGTFDHNLNQLRILSSSSFQETKKMFDAGHVDIMELSTDYNLKNDYLANPSFDIQSKIDTGFYFLGYNMREVRHPIGSRIPTDGNSSISIGLATRKAMNYAINREEINSVVHQGEYAISDYPVSSALGIWLNPNIIQYDYNLEKANYYLWIIEPGTWTPPNPGFRIMISISSLLIVMSISLLNNRKKKLQRN
ncbi:MAG: hypothetical protein FK734_11785 [Asgard group archaeon]|nr:hypothetical protein [Asgard group archaeon]